MVGGVDGWMGWMDDADLKDNLAPLIRWWVDGWMVSGGLVDGWMVIGG